MSKKVVISQKGQVIIPKEIRDKLGLVPQAIIVFTAENGRLIGRKDVSSLPIEKWRGRGKLPRGQSVDDYLKLSRNGNSN